MTIHTVKPGDTVFKIARMHGTSPMKIVEDNGLTNPDRLTVGEELLIIKPTRTYTVRGSDTLAKIAERFSVTTDSLLRKNPYLSGTDKIYPGEILSIKHDAPPFSIACANGYFYKGCCEDRLSLALPYLTYLTVANGKREDGNIELLFNDEKIVRCARERRIFPLMRIYDKGNDFSDKYIDEIISLAQERGYSGITLAPYRAMKEKRKELEEFLMKLKRRTLAEDMLLFLEVDANNSSQIKDVCDGYLLMYEKGHLENVPSFDMGERAATMDFIKECEPSRTYLELPSTAFMKNCELGYEPLLREEAIETAIASGKEILLDDSNGYLYYDFNRYKAGKKSPTRVTFESLKNAKAKLELINELGLMGITFDIMRVPIQHLMMFETMFTKPTLI